MNVQQKEQGVSQPCSFFIGHSQKMNKKVSYADQYLSRTESKTKVASSEATFFFCVDALPKSNPVPLSEPGILL